MSKKVLLILGVICLIGSVLWMLAVRSSTGPFLILAGAGGVLMLEGIYKK